MRNLVTIAVTLLTITLLSSGTVSAAALQAPQATASITASTTAQERKDQRTLAKRNAAAKKLKADLDNQNAGKSNQAK
jgi:broad specificity polyphosphatase/5'/3'-nucleotidase SurE